jgi:Flp pilus assembly protein TadD
MAKLEIKYRLEGKALPPRPIRVSLPGWGGSPDIKKVNGSQPQPWHCPLHVEGATHGVELLYQYEPGLPPGSSDFTLSVPAPPVNYLFATSIDLQPPPGYVLRTEPHPRFFADTTATVPAALYGHLHSEWWPKKIFIVFKIPEPGQTHIFRKGDPYVQILFIPADDTYELTAMTPEEADKRRKLEEDIKVSKSLLAKNVWHSAGGVEFNDHYKVLSRAYERDGQAGVEQVVREAVTRYEEIVPKGKTIAEYFDLARQRLRDGKRTQAKELLHYVMRIEPDNPEVYNRIALLQWDLGVYEDSIRTMRRAVALQPRWAIYHYNLGEMLRRLGQSEQAQAAYIAALQLNPNDPELLSVLGMALAQRGQFAEAAERCRQAIALGQRTPAPHFRMGMILTHQGRTAEAGAYFQAALSIDPAYTPAIEALSKISAGSAAPGSPGATVSPARDPFSE